MIKDKKLKAAIMAVINYILNEQKQTPQNKWRISGRTTIMTNRMNVQSKRINR